MTERLYYQNSFLYDFAANVEAVRTLADGRVALVLDRTAFYATSGGQPHDTGWIEVVAQEGGAHSSLSLPKLHVAEVFEDEAASAILHVIDGGADMALNALRDVGSSAHAVRGFIDVPRRLDHMQQHSGQHVLSAVLVKLFNAPTVSFHLGEESCTIDLDAAALSAAELEEAERRANQVVWEDRQVLMHEATVEQALAAGVRKLPEAGHERLRLIEVRGIDLCACGGTHVKTTGQIGNIQLRKVERVKQGMRVEFICGERALGLARRDFQTLTTTAALYSCGLGDVPAQTEKLLEAGRAAQKREQKLLGEIAELTARQVLAQAAADGGRKVVVAYFAERDAAFVKLFALKLVAAEANVIALTGAGLGTPTLVFAQSPGGTFDAGAVLKQVVSAAGGRGGGTRDLAQGGVPKAEAIPALLERAAQMARAEAEAQK